MNSALVKLGFNSAEQVRRSLALTVPKARSGRRGLPAYVVEAMYADYLRLRSLSKTGKLYGRTRQTVFDLFKGRGLQLEKKTFLDRVKWDGRTFTPGKHGYLRETSGERRQLHKLMWERLHGPIPAGHQVSFKDGNNRNFDVANLVCLPAAEVSLMHYRRLYPDRAGWSEAERRAFWRKHYREFAAERSRKFRARGLRSDGRKRARADGFGRFHYFPPANLLKPDRRRQKIGPATSLTAMERLALI